jgi:hypothetical protein
MNGEQGYQFGIKQVEDLKKKSERNITAADINIKEPKCVSAMQFTSYHVQIRDLEKIQINHFGRLFQEYVVDQYSKIEMQRLLYLQTNQNKLRA